jgi:hypothetical protein
VTRETAGPGVGFTIVDQPDLRIHLNDYHNGSRPDGQIRPPLPHNERTLVTDIADRSTRSPAWPTGNGNSCTASSNSFNPNQHPHDHRGGSLNSTTVQQNDMRRITA